ncbi:MAG: hypothetical protein WCS43_02835 [Verrucomicrobiota bacterium]
MAKQRGKSPVKRPLVNQRRTRISFAEVLSQANQRAHEQANRRSDRRGLKSVRATIAATEMNEDEFQIEWTLRVKRILLAVLLLPFCWVTLWTFLSRFEDSLGRGFWHTREFWYFGVGVLWMTGWFAFRLCHSFLLYIYVLGHELTHALFVWCFFGKVTGFSASAEGGYITTTKTNMLIALSPYFVPFWALVFSLVYAAAKHFMDLAPGWNLFYIAMLGVTWTFHMVWTVWMLPRDQPDLREHGTFFSLVVILLVNLLLLAALLCVAAESPWQDARQFMMEWQRLATTWLGAVWRWLVKACYDFRAAGAF